MGIIQHNVAKGVGGVVLSHSQSSLNVFEFHKLPHPVSSNTIFTNF